MLGVFVFSGCSELLYAYGNNGLCSRMLKNTQMLTMPDRLRSSTSSGVYSDGSSLERTRCTQAEITEHGPPVFSLEAEKFALADSFLPLISIYRASSEVLGDAQQFIEAPQLRIAFGPLVDSSFILTIFDSGFETLKKQQEFTDAVSRFIIFHHGPLLGHTYSTVSSMQTASHRFEMSITGMMNALTDHTSSDNESGVTFRVSELDINVPFLLPAIVEEFFPRLCLLSEELSVSNFGNSCLLFLDGRLMCFAQTETNTCRKYQLRSIIEFANFVDVTSMETDTRVDGRPLPVVSFAQVWIGTGCGKLFLSNVFEIHLTSSAVILCITKADYSNALHGLSCLLAKLNVGYLSHNCKEEVVAIDKQINYLCAMLKEIAADKKAGRDSCDTTFLRNADTTVHFLQNLWHGVKNELGFMNDDNVKLSNRSGRNISSASKREISKRSLWPFTLKARKSEHKIHQIQVVDVKKRSYKLDSMLTYFKHHLKSIMAEIHMKSSHNGNSFHLPRLEDAVRKFLLKFPIDRMTVSTPHTFIRRFRLRDSLHPSFNRLDMIAYTCVKEKQGLRMTFIPDEHSFIRELLAMEAAVSKDEEEKLWSVMTHGSTYLLVKVLQFTVRVTNTVEPCSLFPCSLLSPPMLERCNRLHKRKTEGFQCIAIFDGFVNRELALKQTNVLAAILQRTFHENLRHLDS